MPRKKFEETPYDPIAADLMREVAIGSRESMSLASVPPPRPVAEPRMPVLNVASVTPVAPVMIETPSPRPAESTITKRFLLTRSENEELEAFLLRLQKGAGTKVTLSMFARALVNVAMQAEELLLAELREGTPRRFPSTHDSIAQGAFEEWWMRSLAGALRRLPRFTLSHRSV